MPVFIAEREKERQRCLSCQIIIIALSARRDASESEYTNRRRRRKRKRRRRDNTYRRRFDTRRSPLLSSTARLPPSARLSIYPLVFFFLRCRERERKVKHLEEACTKCVPNNTYERNDEGRKKKGLSNNAVVSSLYDAKSV